MTDGKTLTEILPEMAVAARCDPDGWADEFERYSEAEDKWVPVLEYGIWANADYRRKTKTITRTITYPEPLTVAPKAGAEVWVVDLHSRFGFFNMKYEPSYSWHKELFARAQLHATIEAALEHYRALAGKEGENIWNTQ